MANNKTQPTSDDVNKFLDSVEDEQKRNDSKKVLALMQKVTGEEPVLWGTSIIGFGQYHYKYESGREGDFMMVGFSPRKQNLTLYIMPGFQHYEDLLAKLGKHSIGKSCLYIKKLDDIDISVLEQMVKESYQHMKETNS